MKIEPIVGRRSQSVMSFSETRGTRRVLPPSLLISDRPVIRRFEDLEPVLYDVSSCRGMNPELPVYEVYRDLGVGERGREILSKHGVRYDATVIPPLMLGKEYVKTIGHDHLPSIGEWTHPEVFEVLEGEARFLVQRYRGEEVVDVSLITAYEGDVVTVPPNCGHVVINTSSSTLVVGNLISRDCLQTYDRFKKRRGAAYYLLEGGRLVRNDHYSELPKVRAMVAEPQAFVEKKSSLLTSFLSSPELFTFLSK